MANTSMSTRKEIVGNHRAKYPRSSKKAKGAILDIVCKSTGLSRDRAARLLSGAVVPKKGHGKCGRKPKYGSDVKIALEKVPFVL